MTQLTACLAGFREARGTENEKAEYCSHLLVQPGPGRFPLASTKFVDSLHHSAHVVNDAAQLSTMLFSARSSGQSGVEVPPCGAGFRLIHQASQRARRGFFVLSKVYRKGFLLTSNP